MFDKIIYQNRRSKLVNKIQESGILLFLGNSEASCNYLSNQYQFRQDSTFLYFWGIDQSDLAAIIDLESGEEVLFGNDVDIDDIIWMGPQPLLKEKGAKVGVEKCEPFAKLEDYVKKAISQGRKVHFLPPYRNHNKILLNSLLGIGFDQMKSATSVPFIKSVVDLRLYKESCEIEELDAVADLGYDMHYAAMKGMRLGMLEQELVGVMEGICRAKGTMPSFPIILSQNGETLHNHSHNQIITEGRMLLIDAGAEANSHYASDFTRTLPCSGKFTQKQAEIYSIVAKANNLAIEMSAPGVIYRDVHLACYKVIAQGLIDLGLMRGNADEAVAAGAPALFMPHGLGHNIGLDVHDMEDLGENYVGYDETYVRSKQPGLGSLRMGKELKEGIVVSDEPGIYFIPALIEQWKADGTCKEFINFDKVKDYYNFGGIRLEDDILITADGCRLLGSKRLPIGVQEVENELIK